MVSFLEHLKIHLESLLPWIFQRKKARRWKMYRYRLRSSCKKVEINEMLSNVLNKNLISVQKMQNTL